MNFQTDNVYWLQVSYQGQQIPDNPLAEGISIVKSEDASEPIWGTCSWFDKLNGVMRTIELDKSPAISDKNREILIFRHGAEYRFSSITKELFNQAVDNRVLNCQKVDSDSEAERIIKEINPYG